VLLRSVASASDLGERCTPPPPFAPRQTGCEDVCCRGRCIAPLSSRTSWFGPWPSRRQGVQATRRPPCQPPKPSGAMALHTCNIICSLRPCCLGLTAAGRGPQRLHQSDGLRPRFTVVERDSKPAGRAPCTHWLVYKKDATPSLAPVDSWCPLIMYPPRLCFGYYNVPNPPG
jgi:hypothetical protein